MKKIITIVFFSFCWLTSIAVNCEKDIFLAPALDSITSVYIEKYPNEEFIYLRFFTIDSNRVVDVSHYPDFYMNDDLFHIFYDGYFIKEGKKVLCAFLNMGEGGYSDIIEGINDIALIENTFRCDIEILEDIPTDNVYYVKTNTEFIPITKINSILSSYKLYDRSVIRETTLQNLFNSFMGYGASFLYDICFKRIEGKLFVVFKSSEFYFPNELYGFFKIGERYVCLYGCDAKLLNKFFNPIFINTTSKNIKELKPLIKRCNSPMPSYGEAYEIVFDNTYVPVGWDNPHYYELYR